MYVIRNPLENVSFLLISHEVFAPYPPGLARISSVIEDNIALLLWRKAGR